MPRKPRPLTRDGGRLRDAHLIIIASEDRYAVKQYFGRFSGKRVQVEVLPTEDTRSAPDAVFARLAKFKAEYDLGDGDSLWLCLDTDHWSEPGHRHQLHAVLAASHKNNVQVALTCPCFEFWLLLHFSDDPLTDAGIDPATDASIRCDAIGLAIRKLAGQYSKTRVDRLPLTESHVRYAMRRAETSWNAPEGDIPTQPSTGVHRILAEIDAREAFVFRQLTND